MASPARAVASVLTLAAALALPPAAAAHLLHPGQTLRRLARSADLVVIAELPHGEGQWRAPDGERVATFEARVVEVLAGTPPAEPRFEFFAHALIVPGWQAGDRAILFLHRTRGTPELAPRSVRFPFYSVQLPGREWRISGASDAAIVEATRAYADLAGLPDDQRLPRFRQILVTCLGSSIEPLVTDALSEIAAVGVSEAFLPDAPSVAPFAAIARDPTRPLVTRLALAKALKDRPGFDFDAALVALTAGEHPPAELRSLLRTAADSQAPALGLWIAGVLDHDDPLIRREAAYALGRPWHAVRAPALAKALADPDLRVSRAAVRALGAMGSAAARQALERTVSGPHPRLARLARQEIHAMDARARARARMQPGL